MFTLTEINVLAVIGTDAAPFLLVLYLQPAHVNTEIIDESYIRRPHRSDAVRTCFSEDNAIVRFAL